MGTGQGLAPMCADTDRRLVAPEGSVAQYVRADPELLWFGGEDGIRLQMAYSNADRTRWSECPREHECGRLLVVDDHRDRANQTEGFGPEDSS